MGDGEDRDAAELERAAAAKSPGTPEQTTQQSGTRFRDFLNRLRGFTVLEPACGFGELSSISPCRRSRTWSIGSNSRQRCSASTRVPPNRAGPTSGVSRSTPSRRMARVSIWIGEIQWMRRKRFAGVPDPPKPLDTIECRDAILSADDSEPDWPEADAVVGNPPFLGGKLLISHLGEEYVARMFSTYAGRVPAEADLVCYWFEKAGRQIASGKARRAGLVATNSIRGGANRRALQGATESRRIFEAWSDEPWVIDGAAVRVSLVCFSRADDQFVADARLDGEPVDEIYADLTARQDGAGVDLTSARRLPQNAGVAFMGDTKGGPFDIKGELAREWLRLPANPNGQSNASGLKPWINGMDLTRRPSGKVIVDFGWDLCRRATQPCTRAVPVDPRSCLPRSTTQPQRGHSFALVAAREAATSHVAGTRRSVALHRNAVRFQAPIVCMVRPAYLPRPRADRHRTRR